MKLGPNCKYTWQDDRHIYGPYPPTAQAEEEGCATLGSKYLKELLKENAEQLTKFCLLFPFYHEDKLCYQFIPSPQVLRYPQSNTFVKAIEALLSENETVNISCYFIHVSEKEKREEVLVKQLCEYPTIQTVLSRAINLAHEKGDAAVEKECQAVLDRLPSFRKAWMKEYDKILKNREQMQMLSKNRHLTYSSQKYYRKYTASSEESSPTTEKPELKLK
ncbi:MAG: hypothetical protein QM752_02045 [Gammaproteobacteria bacterium]